MRKRVEQAGWDTCFIINEQGVLLGQLGRRALASKDDLRVEEAMTPGPRTIRPSARLKAIVERMHRQNLAQLSVTTSDGRLLGVLLREDAERALQQ